jgi:hypothetical protein
MKRIDEEKTTEILEEYDHALSTRNYDLVEEIEILYRGTALEKRLKAIRDDRTWSQE